MPNVKFNLDKPNSSESLVLLTFVYNGIRLRYSTQKKIAPKHWNIETQGAKQSSKFPQHPEFNAYLNHLKSETHRIYDRFKLKGKIPSIQEFKKELDFVTLKREKDQRKSFFAFIDSFIEEREKLPKYNKKTITQYKVMRDIFKAYAQKKKLTLDFPDITLEFYNDFLNYLYNDCKYSINYAGNVIKTLKTILNNATEKGLNTNLTFRSKYFKKPKQETDSIYLTITELTQIYHFDFSESARLEKVRDLFIVGCFTGLRFSDFTKISSENITAIDNNEVIKIIPQKAGKKGEPVFIPIHPFVRQILQKYDNGLPKALSNQKMNDYLKEVAQLVGLTEKIQLSKSVAGKRIDRTYEKWEKVSTHTARRSFATNAYKSGVPSLSIMRITDHKTETAFMKYIKMDNEENAVLMAQNKFFNTAPLRVAK